MIFLSFIFGLIWGSFLSVVKNRLDRPKTIFFGRSECPKCKKKLGPVDLIPLVSFIIFRGKCRYCKKKISPEYPLFELISAAMAGALYLKFGLSLASIFLFLSLSVLLIASFIDISDHEVDLGLFIAGIILALAWFFLKDEGIRTFTGLLLAVLYGAILPFGLYLASREKWMGLGDSFFAVWVAAIAGFPEVIAAIFLAFFSGAFFGIITLLIKKNRKDRKLPFGPFLALGGFLAVLWGDRIVSFYLQFFGI